MKILTGLFFLFHFQVTLARVETNTTAGLRRSGTRRSVDNANKKTETPKGDNVNQDSKIKINHHKSHLQIITAGKSTPCDGSLCLKNNGNVRDGNDHPRRMPARPRRTESAFLAKALDSLDHSKPEDIFSTRGEPDKPYKQFTNGTERSSHGSNSATTTLINKPVKNLQGNKRQQWSDLESEMKPRFFFNSAPAEFVEQKQPTAHRHGEGVINLALPPRHGRPHAPQHFHGIGRNIHRGPNDIHMIKNFGGLSPMAMNFFAHPIPQLIPGPLNFHGHHHQLHHLPPPPHYALHINAPPRLESDQTNILPQPLPTVDGPPAVLGEQMPPINPPLVQASDAPVQPNAPVTAQDLPPNFSMIQPPDIPMPSPALDTKGMPPPVNLPAPPVPPPGIQMPTAPVEIQRIPPPIALVGPLVPPSSGAEQVSSPPIEIQGMPPPFVLPRLPIPPPPTTERVPYPVPIPSPPKVEHVPYPIPVPGPPAIQPVMVPIHVPSPPKIHEVRVPVPMPPKIKNVPVPVPVQVPSPPQIQKVPYPVPFPVKEPPDIQKIFYPVAIPQPAQIHHVPYPVYIRYPPEIKKVPYLLRSPPKPYPVAVPSPTHMMIHRVPYPVMYPKKVPYPVPVLVQHNHIHHESVNGGESVSNGQCLVNLCLNGGTCSAYMSTYRCHCQNGYQGKHCEEQNMCKPNPCRNFGVCSQVEHDYECTCMKGYIGKDCDKTDPCIPSPCENGATCSSDGNLYACTCRIGWMGRNCQEESKCLPLNPCQNGGTCTEAQGSYKCDCTPGWTGLSCEVSSPETLHQPELCENCYSSYGPLGQMKRNELRRRITNFKKWNVVGGYMQRHKQRP